MKYTNRNIQELEDYRAVRINIPAFAASTLYGTVIGYQSSE